MSELRRLAELIPAEYRTEIIELNIIAGAQAVAGNGNMEYLITIYKNYIEPSFDPTCGICYSRCLQNFKGILPAIIELEKERKLLDSV